MWLVLLALRRPYTFVVAGFLILIFGIVSLQRMAMDIFPEIDIPVVTVIWQYSGISAEEMERRITTIVERAYTTTVNDIEHIESQSYKGVALIKIYFQPKAKIEAAIAQIAAVSGTVTRILPPNISPPFVVRFNATNVPVLQVKMQGEGFAEKELSDIANNFIRVGLATVQGASVFAYGGKQRQIMVDLDMQALYARGLSPVDVSNAINAQNLILPAGVASMGTRDYDVRLNSSPEVLDALNNLPVRVTNGAVVYVRDVAFVHDGFSPQTSMARQDGNRSAFLSVLKSGNASTLDIVQRVKAELPKIEATLPKGLKLGVLLDQSIFVRGSIEGVVREGIIAAALTALMILLFLGSWRSTVIVATSIPLSIFASITVLSLAGQTINIMSLGGLALAVGILVDDATVTIENIIRNLSLGKPLYEAIVDGAREIAVPTLVSTLSICIVFAPIFLLTGVAGSLFSPLAMAVIFAMLASYLLSRTLVPTMIFYLLPKELHLYAHHDETGEHSISNAGIIWRVHEAFNRVFARFLRGYVALLTFALRRRVVILAVFGIVCLCTAVLVPFLGRDFFPQVDAGTIQMHVRIPTGGRVEETERTFTRIEETIRRIIPEEELEVVLDNIGLQSGPALAFSSSAAIGPFTGDIVIELKEGHAPSGEYIRRIRETLIREFPDIMFFFQPGDIVTQILNFGLPAPIDIQIVGRAQAENFRVAEQMRERLLRVPGAVDVRVNQLRDLQQIRLEIDRTKAEQMGLTQRDVANNMLISLSGNGQTAPSYWLNPQNGVSYSLSVQTPNYRISSMDELQATPIFPPSSGILSTVQPQAQLLRNLSTVSRGVTPANISHYNVQPVIDVMLGVQGRDLGGVAADVERVVEEFRPKLPRGSSLVIRGQVQSMNTAFVGLGLGLMGAIVLVYLLMVVNFQSWLDPFIIITALPGALCGIVWMLFVSHTTLNVPSLMGSIMCIGVATANSILLVSFANEVRTANNLTAIEAALEAGRTRLRPVLMTALAMIIGMLPMALGLGEGGEQNAPLGRAVIGGLMVATATTLVFVPVVYSYLRFGEQKAAAKT